MPGIGKRGTAVAVPALCPLSPAWPLRYYREFFLWLLYFSAVYQGVRKCERPEGMRKRCLFTSLGKCVGKLIHADLNVCTVGSALLSQPTKMVGGLKVWNRGQREEQK